MPAPTEIHDGADVGILARLTGRTWRLFLNGIIVARLRSAPEARAWIAGYREGLADDPGRVTEAHPTP